MSSYNCHNEATISTIGVGVQSKKSKIYLSVIEPIESCINLRANSYTNFEGTSAPVFRVYDKPQDQLNCPEPLCITTGTSYSEISVGTTSPTGEIIGGGISYSYEVEDSWIDYASGVASYYVVLNSAGTYQAETTVTPVAGGTSAVVRSEIVVAPTDVLPKTVLVQHSLEESDTLLSGTDSGIEIKIALTTTSLTTGTSTSIGLSTITLVEDRSIFENNDVVVMTCIDDIDVPLELELNDPSCLGQRPNVDTFAPEVSINAQLVSGNYFKLMALLHKSDATEGFIVKALEKTIGEVTINGETYQGIRLPKYHRDECGFLSAFLPGCNAMEDQLVYSGLHDGVKPEFTRFKILQDAISEVYFMVFNDAHVGLKAVITYPVTQTATVYDLNDTYHEGRRVRVMLPINYKNGKEAYLMSENAFVSSFPFGWSTTDNTPLAFTLTFMKQGENYGKLVVFD